MDMWPGTLFSKKTEGSLRARSRFTIQLITSLSTSVLISNFELQINTRLTGRNGNVFGLERQVLRRGNNRHLLVPHGRAFTCLSCPMTFHSGERWANAWYAGNGRVAPIINSMFYKVGLLCPYQRIKRTLKRESEEIDGNERRPTYI